jgi:hypothetical protein
MGLPVRPLLVMKRVLLLFVLLAVFVGPMSAQEALSKEDVQEAIDAGKAKAKKKCKGIGLYLWDITGNAYHAIWIYTPRAWIQQQSCEAALGNHDVSLTEADTQPVLRVHVVPGPLPKRARSKNSACLSLRTVALADGATMNLLRAQSEEKQTVLVAQKWDWGPVSCEMIVATFSLSDVAALRALTPNAEFTVYVLTEVDGSLGDSIWRVQVRQFKELP